MLCFSEVCLHVAIHSDNKLKVSFYTQNPWNMECNNAALLKKSNDIQATTN